MEVVKAEVTVSKEAYELGLALVKIVKVAKEALKDGASVADLPKLLEVVMSSEFAAGITGLDKLGEEAKADKQAFITAFVVAAVKIYDELDKKEVVA